MRLVDFAPVGRRVSALGFGCASLGSRVDAKRGTAALARAFDAGISWFDVAPSYGDGDAETLLGSFLAGKRSQVVVCTKVGLLPARASLPSRVAKPLAQRALRIAPGLRTLAVRQRAPAQRVPLTGALIESSVQASLRRLQTDYLDVLALHEPSLADFERDDVLRALEKVITAGFARTVSIAGDWEVAVHAVEASEQIQILQIANSPFVPNLRYAEERLPGDRPVSFVSHSVYGHLGALDKLTAILEKDSGTNKLMKSHGYAGPSSAMAAAFLLDFALAANPQGVVLLSMYQPSHLRFALERLATSATSQSVVALGSQLVNPAV
jgi:aryl-alcohol dehydrogenase-like predicted oxidoreductase